MAGLTEKIARHVCSLNYGDLPRSVIENTKKSILDTLGALVAGSGDPEVRMIVDLVMHWGGKPEASILTFREKVPAPNAAFANALMARILELDDVHEQGGHLSVNIVPGALALAEYLSRPVSGKELILAIALGTDLVGRLRMGMRQLSIGWTAPTFAPFGIVAIGSKWAGFSEEQIARAFGVAYSMIPGANMHSPTMSVPAAWTASAYTCLIGVTAFILADKGIIGSSNSFDGPHGLYPLFSRDQYEPDIILHELGKVFEGARSSIKPYPNCKYTHNAIRGVIEIVMEKNLKPEQIESIIITTNTNSRRVAAEAQVKYQPSTSAEAKFSLPYGIAVAVKNRRVALADFSEQAIRDADVLRLCQLVTVKVDPEKDKLKTILPPVDIEIRTTAGARLQKTVAYAKGQSEDPMSYRDVAAKFEDCVRFAGKYMDSKCNDIIQSINKLEKMPDIRELIIKFYNLN